jgi:hypothetical protein
MKMAIKKQNWFQIQNFCKKAQPKKPEVRKVKKSRFLHFSIIDYFLYKHFATFSTEKDSAFLMTL